MLAIDWLIVAGLLLFAIVAATYTNRYTKSIADFLAANRCAGRYLLTIAEGEAGLGAISFIAHFQMYYQAGFTAVWWYFMSLPVGIVINLTGWVIYRFRQTRALTLAEFFERRYSRSFRIFMGIIMFVTGVVNFGIFPAVGANFFMFFCNIPDSFCIATIDIPSYPVLMAGLLAVALYFTFAGGQIAVMVTDFIQGLFTNIVVVVILMFILVTMNWTTISEALLNAPEEASMVNPFKTGKIEDFHFWFFIMLIVLAFYRQKAWQGAQGYNAAALNPHEAKMGTILGSLRGMALNLLMVILAIVGYAVMHHPEYSGIAESVDVALDRTSDVQVRDQMLVPAVMNRLLIPGLNGAFCAIFLAAFISTHNTYLHSWGSIFIQDVVMPFRARPLPHRRHMLLLRVSIISVAVFIFFFSLLFEQKEAILLWLSASAAIYLGGAGAAIIGGLYWKRGTTAGAYAGMITGAVLALGGIIAQQVDEEFFLNGMEIAFISSVAAFVVYTMVSLSQRGPLFNLDRLLHRGQYAIADDTVVHDRPISIALKRLGITHEFSQGDKILYMCMIGWTLFWFGTFLAGTIVHYTIGTTDQQWGRFWHVYVWITVVLAVPITVWLAIGGLIDVRRLFTRLRNQPKNIDDDGWVDNDTSGSTEKTDMT